jgi:hypothetical protein
MDLRAKKNRMILGIKSKWRIMVQQLINEGERGLSGRIMPLF